MTALAVGKNSERGRFVRIGMPIVHLLDNPRKEWRTLSHPGRRFASRSIRINWDEYIPEKYIFAHVSIVSSVNVEEDGFRIKPPCDKMVNSNGNAWTDQMLQATFRSFVGSPVFLEHNQVEGLEKGRILDAVLRPVEFKANGKTATVLFCDILTATGREHFQICDKIENGDLTTMSMGAVVFYTTCSFCGKQFENGENPCSHITNEIGSYKKDKDGVPRIVAEMCGRNKLVNGKVVADEDSMKFVEASWVDTPAFKGAVVNHFVEQPNIPEKDLEGKLFVNRASSYDYLDFARMRVADVNGQMLFKLAAQEAKRLRLF